MQKKINMKHWNTTTKLRVGLIFLGSLTLLLGGISWWQGNILWRQTQSIFDHPLTVRRALNEVRVNNLNSELVMKDLIATNDKALQETLIEKLERYKFNVQSNIRVIRERFLGEKGIVDSIELKFNQLSYIRSGSIRLLQNGNLEEARIRIGEKGIGGKHSAELNTYLEHVNEFSWNKAVEFYEKAQAQRSVLLLQLLIGILTILILTVITGLSMVKSIRRPLNELTRAADEFAKGNFNTRSGYIGKNEFGKLSRSFNTLTATIQTELNERKSLQVLTEKLVTCDTIEELSERLLQDLLRETGAQTGLILLFDPEAGVFITQSTSGIDLGRLRKNWTGLEGEFGLALKSRQIERIKHVTDDSFMAFNSSYGNFLPREILTIPVSSGDEVMALISLGKTSSFEERHIRPVTLLLPLINSRVRAMIAVTQVRALATRLDARNHELQAQQEELTRQSQELQSQNMELEIQKQQLFEASRLKTTFLSNMSHELRTPLNSVIALSGVLGRRLAGKIPNDEFSYLEVIERNGKHLLSLINDILDLSRIESGKEEIELTEFDLIRVVYDTGQMILPQAKQKNIGLVVPDESLHTLIVSDQRKCSQILQNLVGNAVKFTQEGSVTIEISNLGESLEIKVIDTGIGISEDQIQHIFEEFRQADESTARKFGGTGLGLSIARKYARFLGGDIFVQSTPGKGSVFSWVIPVNPHMLSRRDFQEKVPSQAGKSPKPRTITSSGTREQFTVLLVDDSEPAIIQLTDILNSEGFKVLKASGGAEALSLLESQIPDAIVLDLMMPDVDGFQVLKSIRDSERTTDLPVLILTAKHITREELRDLKRNHVFQLIQKGDVNRIELVRAIRNMIESDSPERPSTPPIRLREGQRLTILAVEDNPDNMLTLKALLADSYLILEAVNGLEGVEMAKKFKPDLVLMDIALPEVNGIEALHRIRRDPSCGNVPIIAVTASAMTGDREAIVAEGFDGYLSKPLDGQVLEQMIHRFLQPAIS
jgi:signal transduction histidine kinase/CheY-like chemotaxis protein